MKVLGSYIKQRDVPILLFRLGYFRELPRPAGPLEVPKILNPGSKFKESRFQSLSRNGHSCTMDGIWEDSSGSRTISSLTSCPPFHYHLDGLSENQRPKKLKQNPRKGVIKIEERFDNNFSIVEYRLSNDIQQSEVIEDTKASPISQYADPAPVTQTIETPYEETEPIAPTQTENRPTRMPPLYDDEERLEDVDEWDNEDYDYSNDEEDKEDEEDEPMTYEEFDDFIDRQMKKGKNSKCLNNELLAG